MGLREEMAADVGEIVGDLPAEFAWAGATYACFADTDSREVVLGTRGNPVEASLALLVQKPQFPNSVPPGSGQVVSFNGRYYKVAKVTDLRDASAAWLYCEDARKAV